MPDSKVTITEGAGTNIDTRTNAGGDHRQVIVVGDPSITDSVAVVKASDPASNDEGVVVRDPNTTAIVSGLRDVRVQSLVDGTVSVENITRVRNVVDGTLSLITRVDRVINLIDGTLSVVTFVPAVQRVQNVVDGTLTTVTGVDRVRNLVDGTITTVTRVDRVMNLVDGTISTVGALTGITNSIQVHILSTNGTMAVNVGHITDTMAVMAKDGTFAVYFSPNVPSMNVAKFNGNAAITPNAGIPAINIYATANIFTVAGSTSGVSVSGVTLVSPSANANFKVFAFSLTSTGTVHQTISFANGNGAAQTKFWEVGLQAPSQGIAGANLAVSPPGFLFETGLSTTLVLFKDTGSLVHYSVSYIKESA